MSKIPLIIKAKHLGPLEDVSFKESVSSLKIALFAPNGSGKTFLSRAFNSLSKHQRGAPLGNTDSLITFEQDKATFSFDASLSDKNTLNLFAERGKTLSCTCDTNWILHVFNRDFIEDALRINTYTVKNEIEGEIIVGEANSKIFELQNKLIPLATQTNNLKTKIENAIQTAQKNLKSLGITTALREYKDITYVNVINGTTFSTSFEKAKTSYEKLKSLPENLLPLKFLPENIDTQSIDLTPSLLSESVSLSTIKDSIKKDIQDDPHFIESGIKKYKKDESRCPFCKQDLQETAKLLLEIYVDYFKDAEAMFDKKLLAHKTALTSTKKAFKDLECDFNSIALKYSEQKGYFEDIKDNFALSCNFEIIYSHIDSLIKDLDSKKINKEKTEFSSSLALIEELNEQVETLRKELLQINKKILELNERVSHAKQGQLTAKKNLCQAMLGKLYKDNLEDIEKIKVLSDNIQEINSQIKTEKASTSIKRKEAVDETFTKLLKEFFDDTYTYDPITEKIKHKNKHPITSAKDVISEGEKGVIAFCHYLALIHSLVSTKEDYERLFLVIDDPISSLDFNYVYQVAQEIRNLDKNFSLSKVRFLIFTHNMEFMSVLVKNNIVNNSFMLKKSKITVLNKKFLLPYESYLTHLYLISENKQEPEYYTPNAIRHVLEALCNFHSPVKKLDAFIETEQIFEGSAAGYSLINDLSHGRIRTCDSCTPDKIKILSTLVINYIKKKFPGQIESINKNIPHS